jgi:DNA (cytosine-5)-methyltransferase 1
MLTHGSLFTGIGGFDLGFERAGIQTAWQVEIDPFCRKVLERHWPNVQRFSDIRGCGRHNLPRVDVLSGGFPCQDISYAGLGAGIDGERSGLWSEYFRIIGELRPRVAVVENVPALLERGMGRVLGDLASIGYDAEWRRLPASAFGANHLRERVWIVAHSNGQRFQGCELGLSKVGDQGNIHAPILSALPLCKRLAKDQLPKPYIVGSHDGIPNRAHRIKSLGNAVVPQVAEWIGRRIVECMA